MSWTLDLVKQEALSSVTRHWTYNSGKRCRVWLDIGPGTAERAVERDSTLDLVRRKALSSLTRHRTDKAEYLCR